MVGPSNAGYVALEEASFPTLDKFQKVSIIPLVFLIFYEVSGGTFGVEDSVQAAGPLLALLGFLIFLFIWSIPEALITAEMGTMFPENGGYVVWVSSALGPYWGFQQGWMKWLSGVIDDAPYPSLFPDNDISAILALEGGFPRIIAVLALTVAHTSTSYRGLSIVGWVAILLGVFFLLPFVLMGLLAIPKLEPSRWPYKIPVGTVGAILICIPPTLIILVVLALASLKVMAISIIVVIIGLIMQPCLDCAENKRWFRFSKSNEP